MTRPRGIVRQGDVLLVPVESLPPGGKHEESGSRFVLAEGEATGHAHVVEGRSRLVRTQRGLGAPIQTFVVVEEPAALVHDEHDPIALSPGPYEVRRQREYAPQPRLSARSFRWVTD
jgi:hypothetical protein